MIKTYEEINQKLKSGKAVVLTAEEVSKMAKEMSPEEIVEKVDVVTTATFGPMGSSGCVLNFGHSKPKHSVKSEGTDNTLKPVKFKVKLNISMAGRPQSGKNMWARVIKDRRPRIAFCLTILAGMIG